MRVLKSFTCLAILAAFFAFAAPAGAHRLMVTGVSSCSDGTHIVTWTITNDHQSKAMTVNASSIASGTSYAVDVVTNPVPAASSTTATSEVPGGVTSAITITVVATWPDEFTKTVTATVDLPDDCATTVTTSPATTAPPTTAPPTTPTSTGVSPSTIVPTTPGGVLGVESPPGELASTGSPATGAAVTVGFGLIVVGAGLVALKRKPARG